jgi:transposase
LIAIVKNYLKDNPCNGQVFVFINKNRSLMKCLYFEPGGYCIWSKRLEQGRFSALGKNSLSTKITLTTTEFAALVEGFDIAIKKRRKRYIHPA